MTRTDSYDDRDERDEADEADEPTPHWDDDLSDVEAEAYERGLDRIAARLGY